MRVAGNEQAIDKAIDMLQSLKKGEVMQSKTWWGNGEVVDMGIAVYIKVDEREDQIIIPLSQVNNADMELCESK